MFFVEPITRPTLVGIDLRSLATTYVRSRVRRGDLTPATGRGTRSKLERFADSFGARSVMNITERSVNRWLETIGHMASATRRNHWSTISTFLDWLALEGHIKGNPMRHMRAPRVPRRQPRALAPEDVGRVLEVCPDTRARLLVLIKAQCGCRRIEIARMEIGDIRFSERTVRVVGKGGHERDLPVPDEAWETLTGYLREYPASTGPLIRSYNDPHRGLSPSTISHMLSDLMYRAGVKGSAHDGVSGHALRHTAATDMLRSGAHVRDVQAALGHAHLVTTERYLPTLVRGLAETMAGRRYSGAHRGG
jgi:site-specific recombinase XerD